MRTFRPIESSFQLRKLMSVWFGRVAGCEFFLKVTFPIAVFFRLTAIHT